MRILLTYVILCVFFYKRANAQPENNVWVFGYHKAIEFSSGAPISLPDYLSHILEGGAAISDNAGNILFYTDGIEVRNRDHVIMPNGSDLLMSDSYPGSVTSTQGTVICKSPQNANQYFLFNIDPNNYFGEYVVGYLRYSIIDMTLDGGNGDVLTSYKNIILDSLVHEKMVLVSRDACNAWLLVYSYMMEEYRAYPITTTGIGAPVISPSPYNSSGSGELCISPDRSKILNINNGYSKFELATFDPATGIVSNFNEYSLPLGSSIYGGEFSPNSNVIYVNQNLGIYQYDVTDYPIDTEVLTSAYNLGTGYVSSQLRLANDGKIYNINHVSTPSLGCINNPDALGAACDYEAVVMSFTGSIGLSLGSPTVSIGNFAETSLNVIDTLICFESSALLTAPISSGYLWDDGSTASTRTITASGTYWVKYGEFCDFFIDTFHVSLIDTNLNFFHNDTVICGTNTFPVAVEEREGYEYLWMSGGVFENPTSASTNVSVSESGTIIVRINHPNCDTFYKSFFVEVKEILPFDLGENTTICLGKSFEVIPDIAVEEDEDVTYSWSPTLGVSDPSSRNVILSPTVSTTYYLTVNYGALDCEYTDSIRINVISNEMTLINNDTSICKGSTIVLSAVGHPSFSYYWTPETGVLDPHSSFTGVTPESSGYIHVRASKLGCDDMYDSFYVTVEPVPTVDVGDDMTLCGGVPTQLFASVVPLYEDYTYRWSPGSRLNDSTIKDPIYTSFNVSDQMILTVTTPNGCTKTDTMEITTIPKRSLEVNTNDTGFCYPGFVNLEAWNAESYKWSPSAGLSNDTIPNPIASPDYTTMYQVVGNTSGCLDTQYVQVSIYPNATIYLDDTMIVYVGESKEIKISSNASYFEWYPPEGLSSTSIANPIASPSVRTRYFVTATTEYGCEVLDSIDVVVDLDGVFEIPNAFVPGNDLEKNGIFKPIIHGDVTIRNFQIWNRWGQIVFQSTDREGGWDGTMDGKPQPMGVYVYVIEVELPNGHYIQRQGNVTLIR